MIGFLNKKTAIYWVYIILFYKYVIFINLFKMKNKGAEEGEMIMFIEEDVYQY